MFCSCDRIARNAEILAQLQIPSAKAKLFPTPAHKPRKVKLKQSESDSEADLDFVPSDCTSSVVEEDAGDEDEGIKQEVRVREQAPKRKKVSPNKGKKIKHGAQSSVDINIVREAFSLFEGTADQEGSIGIADLMRLGHKHEKQWKRADYVSMVDMFNSESDLNGGRKINFADFAALFEEGKLAPVVAKKTSS